MKIANINNSVARYMGVVNSHNNQIKSAYPKLNMFSNDTVSFSGNSTGINSDFEYYPRQFVKSFLESSALLNYKIEEKMCVYDEYDIKREVADVKQSVGNVPKEDILKAMARVTAYSSYNSLAGLSSELRKRNIGNLYTEPQISSNQALNYVMNSKRQAPLKGNCTGFILDEYGLDYLNNLKKYDTKKFQSLIEQIKKSELKLIYIEGWETKIGNKYYSYNIFDQSKSLSEVTSAIINNNEHYRTPDLSKSMFKGIKDETERIFGQGVPITTIPYYEQERKIKEFDIVNQMRPPMPTEEKIYSTISVLARDFAKGKEVLKNGAENILHHYFDTMIEAYSPKSMSVILKDKYYMLERNLKSLGKTMDDALFVYPKKNASTNVVLMQFAKANNIKPNKFEQLNSHSSLRYENKAIVLIDDIISSGDSVLDTDFGYQYFDFNNYPQCNFIFSPIVATDNGIEKINDVISENGRTNQDIVLENNSVETHKKFLNDLYPNEQRLFAGINNQFGYGNNGMCIAFPYMIPDNNSAISGIFLRDFLINGLTSVANKGLKAQKHYRPYDIHHILSDSNLKEMFEAIDKRTQILENSNVMANPKSKRNQQLATAIMDR